MAYRYRKKQKKRSEDPYKYVSRLLKYRLRSEKEIRDRLSQRFPFDVVEEVVSKLKEKSIIDDKRFAYMYAKDHLQIYRHGPKLIRAKLKALGIDEDIIDEGIQAAWNEFDIEAFIKEISRKKNDLKEIKKFLYKRGFDTSILDNVDIEIDRR
ncbi:MAG: RecX family transcriptional regulator [Thermotogaceae bacterium]|nr:RecX family transcriptional regulator [Thermotogaceae bacterium]